MFPNTIENWISSMAIFYIGIPIFLFVGFQNLTALKISGIILIADGITAVIKLLTMNTNVSYLKRPKNAEGCNLQMTGKQGGQPGFPSGHMATTTAFWFSAYALVPQMYRMHTLVAGVLFSSVMMWSRMKKSCHTFVQCIAGASVGIVVAFLGIRFLDVGTLRFP